MKSSPNHFLRESLGRACATIVLIAAAGWMTAARGGLPPWIRNIEARSAVEAALFRIMALPGGGVLFRRPPSETRPALAELIKSQPADRDLYSLRAQEDEQQLDFAGAESDWKLYTQNSPHKIAAQIALADFYHRRLRPADEIGILAMVASAPADPSETLTPASQQRSWRAFERIFGIISAQGLPKAVSMAQYHAWIARYPHEKSLYTRFLSFVVSEKEYGSAGQLIADYGRQFPEDQVFPIKAKAMLEYRRGSVQQGLAVYEQSFQPLWDPELIKGYFDLLTETQNLRSFLDQARAAQNANPGDLDAASRIFYYYQQQGKLDAAQATIADFRAHKETTKSPWAAQELYTCARLLEAIHSYPEAARYYFALYSSGMNDAQERALSGLANVLLTAPEMPIRFGSGDLSMYRDIATMDQGPGFFNGILSLLLNSISPASELSIEEQAAVPYFHRTRAAELLAQLDTRFPNASARPALHAKLLGFYASSGESDAVIHGGQDFLQSFPAAPQRTEVALLMADAYARENKTQQEFSIYDSVLQELAARSDKVPLGTRDVTQGETNFDQTSAVEDGTAESGETQPAVDARTRRSQGMSSAFRVNASAGATESEGPRSPEYARVLERYLARLVEGKEIPQAMSVLRREIDRNPDDPGLYERLAQFLDQNRLGSEQDEVYKMALAHFSDRSWYHKLARFYLRYRRNADFDALTQEAVRTFSGTELESYFLNTGGGGSPALYLRVNQYANRRFPHNPVFVRNLLAAYHGPMTYDEAAWEALLRQHWFEEPELRNTFFEFLSVSGRLNTELAAIHESNPASTNGSNADSVRNNPAAGTFIAQADLWRSHFEESAPVLEALANLYPDDPEISGAASAVARSLAYFDPAQTAVAAKIEDNRLHADPGNTEILARIGDIYADRDLFAQAAPYWEQIASVAPGQSGGYLEAATIYWDYFDFGNALRLLEQGRSKLHDQALYSYEEGAIYENEREYGKAIHEYAKGSLAATTDSQAEARLLELARRPKLRNQIEDETSKIASAPDASITAIDLRVRILEAQNRKEDLAAFLESAIASTTSIEQAEDLENLAQQKSLEHARQAALEKQVALTKDPITRMQLRYALARLYEDQKNFPPAQKTVEALYRENPKILGIVRSTVDFYWRMKMPSQAISVLLEAAKDSHADLSRQFTFEAARKLTEAGQFAEARILLAQLLEGSPYNGEYLAAMADTFARAGDDRGLQQFYLQQIAALRNAPLSSDDRKAKIATLRRGLIPALTRMKDYAGAVDQYVELINNFPEDDGLVSEASFYALRYQRAHQLTDFYGKTVAQSPKDYRWSMVLARIQANLEDYGAAIDTYGKAMAIRPDRSDLRIARGELEERLMRFDDAASDYERVYQLAYKDPQWMEKVAEIRARQGRTSDAVAALKIALIDGRPQGLGNYFDVARWLEGWGMLTEARGFAEQGISAAGPDLLTTNELQNGTRVYARIMTRLREQEKAYATLQAALSSAASLIPVMKEQVVKGGISALTDSTWRERTRQVRIATARAGMTLALEEMGRTADHYFTPEEKVAFAHFADSAFSSAASGDLETFGIPLAKTAEFSELEARWHVELMMHGSNLPERFQQMTGLIDLERRRLKFAELGDQLAAFAGTLTPQQRPSVWSAAADAYRSVPDEVAELHALENLPESNLWGVQQKRLFGLLLARQPDELVRRASSWTVSGQAAADFALAHGSPALAHAVVAARGRARPPVWSKSYDALVGLYFSQPDSSINLDFLEILDDRTVGERLAKPVDRSQQLAGDIWFYYGARYGEYLGATRQGNPEDYLAAELEQSPGSASSYFALGDYYADSGDPTRALAEYNHTLELAPARDDVHDRLALAYYKLGQKEKAVSEWKLAFSLLGRQTENGTVPETFWADFGRVCDHLRTRHLFADLKPDADAVIRGYLRRNGNYRSNAILHSAFAAQEDPASAVLWLLDLSSAAHNPTQVLIDVVDMSWIPLTEHRPIYQRILQAKQEATLKAEGLNKEWALTDLRSWQLRWAAYLVTSRQYVEAEEFITGLPEETRKAEVASLIPLDLQAAVQTGSFDAKLGGYHAEPDQAPASDVLRNSARRFSDAGDKQSARKILEFVFSREINDHQLIPANFLSLAEIRLAAGDTEGAIDLLRRLVIAIGKPYDNLDSAAALLENTGHNAEAIEFLDALVKASPWQPAYRLRLAKAEIAAGKDSSRAQQTLVTIATSLEADYTLRCQATAALPGSQAGFGSKELDLLASAAAISSSDANQPFFYAARLKAAQQLSVSNVRISLLSSALADQSSRDDARLPLFEAAAAAHSDEFALGVIEPLRSSFLTPRPSTGVTHEEEVANENEDANHNNEGPDASEPASTAGRAAPAHEARLAWEISNVMLRLHRLDEAVPYLERALRLEKSPPQLKQIKSRIASTKSDLRREQTNAARQPVLHEALEQNQVVRPRLTAVMRPAKPETKGAATR